MKQNLQIDIGNSACVYERLEVELPVARIEHGIEPKTACQTCPTFNKNLACPPFSPEFTDYVKGAQNARILCIRIATSYFSHDSADQRARACFKEAGKILRQELLQFRRQGYRVAGSGECLACDPCVAVQGGLHCAKPLEQIYSLESLGVDVIALVRQCFDLDLEWNRDEQTAQTISAVGAAFF